MRRNLQHGRLTDRRHHATPWGCTRLFELRHRVGETVPAQVSRYATPPIRSDILASDTRLSLRDRPSCELTRRVPSTLAVGRPLQARLLRYPAPPGLRPARPRRACCHARVSDHAAWPSSA